MLKIILQSTRQIKPFNEPARELRIQNKPLWLHQRDALTPFVRREMEIPEGEKIPRVKEPSIVYRDNLFFDSQFIESFLTEAVQLNKPVRAAFTLEDTAFREHCLPLSDSYTKIGDLYYADLWYYPHGPVEEDVEPLIVSMQAREIGYYHVPTYMASQAGDLIYYVPLRSMIAIDSWVHIFIADMVFGLFGRGARFENNLNNDLRFKLRVVVKAIYEGKQVLDSSALVTFGKNCVIDPSAVIHGPTTIGDNVTINAGVVIENCIIGDNVNISQGCQLMLSVVGDGTFLPFRASLFMTTMMDNAMVAQNACLQMCVIGRNSFVGAGTTFTDFNLLSDQIKALDGEGNLSNSNRPVLGGCVGHNCRIGSGIIVYPARTIESDVVLIASRDRPVVDKDITYEESDHHKLPSKGQHRRLYPRQGELVNESW
jgi:UDP-N-acetylglucosamine diphosphorylase / glucose-1-phosphate thymidylyltransferase / UDP-N-acetylgalactosamine diphosphorylase / glucosamine-1-phosphate N-acetyltransferase / galactosamine-1-phosphate N-acetyltransferase